MNYAIQEAIDKLSKMYNYFEGKSALKLLNSMSEEEKCIVLADHKVQSTILKIDDNKVLREIFRKSPTFFQEIMFSNRDVQDRLISPTSTLKRKELFANYNKRDYSFSNENIRQLENFFHTIKSPKIYEMLIESKFFQRIIALCYDKQLTETFFKNIDTVKLFYNIINDDEIFQTRLPRKRNILQIFNKLSNHVLLSDDYAQIIANPANMIAEKAWWFRNSKIIYVDERTLSLFNRKMLIEFLNLNNIDHEFVENCLKDNILAILKTNGYDFKEIFSHLLNEERNIFSNLDYVYFKVIAEECEKNEVLKNKFIDFIYGILCNTPDLDDKEKILIKETLYRRISSNSISMNDYQVLFFYPDALKTIFYLKFGKVADRMDYLNNIKPKQIIYLNVRHINQIIGALKLENEDELSNTYSYAIRLYLTFGLERTLKILNGDYGNIDEIFFNNVSFLDVSNVDLIQEGNKYIPNISTEFINFMFANQKSNHFIDMLKDSKSYLRKYWRYLYNNFAMLKEKCHGLITLKKLNIIFKQLSNNRDISDVTPDNYRLNENDILEDVCLGNKTGRPNDEIYKTLLDIYEQMKRRTESSIPYVKGEVQNGYSYEMMKLNDPIAFTLGYKGNCCIRVNDIAHNHLLHATLCRNGRILLIYNNIGELAAFVPLKRNGEVLIANSIECAHKKKNSQAIEAFMDAINDIVATSHANTKDNQPINLVCIGYEAYAKPAGLIFPSDIKTPTIYEKSDVVYSDTDRYHRTLTIFYQNPSLDLHEIQYGDPKASYRDPRNSFSFCDFTNASDNDIKQALKIVNAVRYANSDLNLLENFRMCDRYGIKECIYNDDWYIIISSDGNIYGEYLHYDDRAAIEYTTVLERLKDGFGTVSPDNDIKRLRKFE